MGEKKERTAVVTGAGRERSIGRQVARTLAVNGWSLALFDIEANEVRTFADQLAQETGQQVLGFGVDITDQASVEAAFIQIDQLLPQVVANVNLAGIPSPTPFFEITDEIFTRVMDVNAKGTLFMMQAAARRMIEHGAGGRIVNTASITAFDGGGTFSKTAYAAAKAAVLGLTRGGARELGPYGITCNAIIPGPIDTDIMGGTLSDERKAVISADVPLQRVGQPHEVAGLINFLVSDDSSFVNGASISVDGGKYMM